MTENPWDICECGDYRDQHEDGTGRCIFGTSHIPRGTCLAFNFSYSRPEDEEAWRRGQEMPEPTEVRKNPFYSWDVE